MGRQELGKYGEDLAIRYLQEKSYKIVDRNFDTKYGEIDIIAKDGSELVFVEVKTRTSTDFGYPEGAINQKKLLHLERMVQVYQQKNNIMNTPIRVDAISVDIDQYHQDFKIHHFQNIIN